MKPYLQKIAEQGTLTLDEAEAAMHLLMRGEATPEEMAGLLMGLRSRGETINELTGFARVMRAYAVPVRLEDPDAIDIVGTGGDGGGTFNISTAAAFVCAGAGVTVAKHGNRSVSSKCGSADVLAALGVRTDLDAAGVERCLREAGIAFLFAPTFHPAVRHVMPVRRALGVRTFFNILGPLCNPAGVRRYLIGAFSREVARQMIRILSRLGATYAMTVHAQDGLDEFSLAAPTTVYVYDATRAAGLDDIEKWTVTPERHGLEPAPIEALAGGDAEENAAILRAVLGGARGPHRDVVVLNAAYALKASGRFDTIESCFEAARESLDSGAARARLDALIDVSNAV